MLLAVLGLTGLIAPLFGPTTLTDVHTAIGRFLHGVFNPEVANNLVGDTDNTILNAPRGDVVSVGLIVSLWAGSSATSALIEAITIAYRQHEFRHPAVERLFALLRHLGVPVRTWPGSNHIQRRSPVFLTRPDDIACRRHLLHHNGSQYNQLSR